MDSNETSQASISLRHAAHFYKNGRISWSPNGEILAVSSGGGNVSLLALEDGAVRTQFSAPAPGPGQPVIGTMWSPDNKTLALARFNAGVIQVYDAGSGELVRTLIGKSLFTRCVVLSPMGDYFANAGGDHIVLIREMISGENFRKLKGHSDWVSSIAWSNDGARIAVGCRDGLIAIWDVESAGLVARFRGQNNFVRNVLWSPDDKLLIAGGSQGVIEIWDVETGRTKFVLEGHTRAIRSLDILRDGQLIVSKSSDATVRFWKTATSENVATFPDAATSKGTAVAFNPKFPILATFGSRTVRMWDLNLDLILRSPTVTNSIRYTNAKVVLVGETGVGKTGLGVRLAEGIWKPSPGSTHGMNVWTLHSEAEREVMLWDFAGQDEYRLVHQLFLNETNVALLLYDPTKSDDTFFGIEYWEKALQNAVPRSLRKFLVAARVDVGTVRMTNDEIKEYCRDRDYVDHHITSAETNEGCDKLRDAIKGVIRWEELPQTISPEIFKHIKDFLTTVRQGNRILVRENDLRAEFNALTGTASVPSKAQFRTVIGHVETAGLIKRLSFGDFVLLKPELLNGYASDVIDAARRHPDGLGAVRKSDVLDGMIKLKDDGGLSASDKIFMLHATVELFLRLGLALEQDGNLVFPSKFNRQMPPLEEDPSIEVEFGFEGPVENLYTTLVVKLYYGGIFRLKKLWKNAAEFLNGRDQVCGFQLYTLGDGRGSLKVFYADRVTDDDKALFLKIVADHFREKQVDIERRRTYRCPRCREIVRDPHAVERAVEKKKDKIFCQDCGGQIPFIDALETLYQDDTKFLSQIVAMEGRAEANMERGGELVSAAAEMRTENFKAWTGGAELATVAIVFTDVVSSTALNVNLGDESWSAIRRAHFMRARRLIDRHGGYLIKTMGDSVMAAFHSASDALDFALAFDANAGHDSIRVRAGIHIGPVEVQSEDAFGQQVSMAARVEGRATEGGIWVSSQVKHDIDVLRAARHSHLKWTEHPDQMLSGFPKKYTLWSVAQ